MENETDNNPLEKPAPKGRRILIVLTAALLTVLAISAYVTVLVKNLESSDEEDTDSNNFRAIVDALFTESHCQIKNRSCRPDEFRFRQLLSLDGPKAGYVSRYLPILLNHSPMDAPVISATISTITPTTAAITAGIQKWRVQLRLERFVFLMELMIRKIKPTIGIL